MATSTIAEFMESPLVTWAQTISTVTTGSTLEYKDLADGIFLNDVMELIDHRFADVSVQNPVEDVQTRLHNLDALLKNVKFFYHEILKQLIVMGLPNVVKIARHPEGEVGEVRKMLLLVLGCAVQCEKKEEFIENIKQLDLTTQHAIVLHIREITDNAENVFHAPWSCLAEVPSDQLEELSTTVISHLKKLVAERDGYVNLLTEYVQEIVAFQSSSATSPTAMGPSASPKKKPPPGAEVADKNHHLGVELADCKSKLRRMRQEVEEKNETIVELKEELAEKSNLYAKTRQDNLELTQEARAARTYRDELDILRDKASRVDKLDLEINRYKEKLNELDYYRARVDELREDNVVLLDTKTMLEEQLATSHSRLEGLVDLEDELMSAKEKLIKVESERDTQRDRLAELIEEMTKLECEKNLSMSESNTLGKELEELKSSAYNDCSSQWSLSDQIHESASAKIHRLELENQKLSTSLESLRKDNESMNALLKTEGETQARRMSEVERENQRLANKIVKLTDSSASESQKVIELEEDKIRLVKDADDLRNVVETVRENSQRQINELERENSSLTQMISTLRERNQKSEDAKLKELEKENEKYSEMVRDWRNQASALEGENRGLNRQVVALQEAIDKYGEIEKENARLGRQAIELNREIATLRLTGERLNNIEKENADLQFDNQKLRKDLANAETAAAQNNATEEALVSLKAENQRLTRHLESTKEKSEKMLGEMEGRKDEVERENAALKRQMEADRRKEVRATEAEAKIGQLETSNRKLTRELELAAKRIANFEKENQEHERENENLVKTVESLKASVQSLEELERELAETQEERNGIQAQCKTSEKENKRLKAALAVKESTIDENLSRISAIEREIRILRKTENKRKDVETRVKELEQENQELTAENGSDKKTLAALREELVNEKIQTQHLGNEVERLTASLEKAGLDKARQVAKEEDAKLTSMSLQMDEAYKKSLALKEEKIDTLQKQLEEMTGSGDKLRSELKNMKMKYEEALKREEEAENRRAPAPEPTPASSFSRDRPGSIVINAKETVKAQRELLVMKDRLVELERVNATLQAEKTSNADQARFMKEQLDSTLPGLHAQIDALQAKGSSTQAENAKLQVEIATYKSQNATLLSAKSELTEALAKMEESRDNAVADKEDFAASYETLIGDHESLTALHEQLTRDYEMLTDENALLKTKAKVLKGEIKEVQERLEVLGKEKDHVESLKTALEDERDAIKRQSFALRSLPEDYEYLQQEVQKLSEEKVSLGEELKRIQREASTAKSEHHALQILHTKLQGEFQDCKSVYDEMDIQMHKIALKCETLESANDRLEDDNRNLMLQLQTMITQNAELLQTTLSNKDVYHEEERQMIERLNALQRQKEKLEEKIMSQYKDKTPKKNKGGIGATLVRKARQVMGKKPRSAGKDGVKSNTGSEGSGAEGESGRNGARVRHDTASPWSMRMRTPSMESPSSPARSTSSGNLSMQQRKLASSTNALNVMSVGKAAQEGSLKRRDPESRMYRSSENILDSSLFDCSPRQDDEDDDHEGESMHRRRSQPDDHHYDVIESLNLGDESSRTLSSIRSKPPDVTSYTSADSADRNHHNPVNQRRDSAVFHATPRDIGGESQYDPSVHGVHHRERDLPAPPSALPSDLQALGRNCSSRASSHRSSCASDEMVVPPVSTAGDVSRRNSSKIPFSTPEYHHMTTSPSSQGSGGVAHQSPSSSSTEPRSSARQLGSPGSELVSLHQFLAECNNDSNNGSDDAGNSASTGDYNATPETRRREAYVSDFKQDPTKGLSYYSSSTLGRRNKDSLHQPRPKSTFELSSPIPSARSDAPVNGNHVNNESMDRLRNGIDELYNECASTNITQQPPPSLLRNTTATIDSPMSGSSSNNNSSYAESKFSTLDNRKTRGAGGNGVTLRPGAGARPVSTPARRFSHGGAIVGSPNLNSANERLDWLIGNSPVKVGDGSGGTAVNSPLSVVPEVNPQPRTASTSTRPCSVSTSTPLRPIPTRPSQSSQSSVSSTPSLPRTPHSNRSSQIQSAPAKDVNNVASSSPLLDNSSPAARAIARGGSNPRGSSNDSIDSYGTPASRTTSSVIRPKLLTTSPRAEGSDGSGEGSEKTTTPKGQPDPVEKNSIWYEYGCV